VIVWSSSRQEIYVVSGHGHIGELRKQESKGAVLRVDEIADGEGQSTHDKEDRDEGDQVEAVFRKVSGQDELVDSGEQKLLDCVHKDSICHLNIFFIARERIDRSRIETQDGHMENREGNTKDAANLMPQGECDAIAHRVKMGYGNTLHDKSCMDIIGRGHENESCDRSNENSATNAANARLFAMRPRYGARGPG